MGRSSVLGLGLVSVGVLALVSGLGCQPNTTSTGGSGGGGAGGGGTMNTGGMNTGGMSTGGQNTGGMNTGGNTGGTGGSTNTDPCTGDAIAATVYQITEPGVAGAVGPGIKVKVDGLIATSRKFLVSKSSSTNSCLWGVFASAPKDEGGNQLLQAAPYSGILVLSYGNDATPDPNSGTYFCPKLADAADIGDVIPNDIKPGDTFNVYGKSDKFLLSACASQAGGSEVGQFQISQSCKMEKVGTAAIPAPYVVPAADYAKIGSPTDEDFHGKFGGVQLEVKNVTPKSVMVDCPAGQSSCLVNKFGQIAFEEGFGTGDKIYYRGYSQNFCHKGPIFDPGTTFTSVAGIHYLDFCTWNVQQNDKCADFDPASTDCAGATTCTFDQ